MSSCSSFVWSFKLFSSYRNAHKVEKVYVTKGILVMTFRTVGLKGTYGETVCLKRA